MRHVARQHGAARSVARRHRVKWGASPSNVSFPQTTLMRFRVPDIFSRWSVPSAVHTASKTYFRNFFLLRTGHLRTSALSIAIASQNRLISLAPTVTVPATISSSYTRPSIRRDYAREISRGLFERPVREDSHFRGEYTRDAEECTCVRSEVRGATCYGKRESNRRTCLTTRDVSHPFPFRARIRSTLDFAISPVPRTSRSNFAFHRGNSDVTCVNVEWGIFAASKRRSVASNTFLDR